MTKRRGFAVRISDHMLLTPNEAAVGQEEGPEFLFVLYMGEGENAKAFYFDRSGLDKLFRTFQRTEHWIKEAIDGIRMPTPAERLITALEYKKTQMREQLVQIDAEIKRLEDNVLDDAP